MGGWTGQIRHNVAGYAGLPASLLCEPGAGGGDCHLLSIGSLQRQSSPTNNAPEDDANYVPKDNINDDTVQMQLKTMLCFL